MAWQTAQRGRGNRGAVGSPELQVFARELRDAILDGSGRGRQHGANRKPEWRCSCGCTNFDDRTICRRCANRWGGAIAASPPPPAPYSAGITAAKATGDGFAKLSQAPARLPQGSAWAAGPPGSVTAPKPATRAGALERAIAAARDVGAPAAAIEAMQSELVTVRAETASTRPLTSRLDLARARLRKAKTKTESTQQALEKAKAEHAEALANLETTRAEFKALEEEFKASSGPSVLPDGGAVVKGARGLLQKLESSALGDVPEKILAAMRTLHTALADTGT